MKEPEFFTHRFMVKRCDDGTVMLGKVQPPLPGRKYVEMEVIPPPDKDVKFDYGAGADLMNIRSLGFILIYETTVTDACFPYIDEFVKHVLRHLEEDSFEITGLTISNFLANHHRVMEDKERPSQEG